MLVRRRTRPLGDQISKTIQACPGGLPPCTTLFSLASSSEAVSFDLNAGDEDLFTADAGLGAFQAYDYPSGTLDTTVSLPMSGAYPLGVALWKDNAR